MSAEETALQATPPLTTRARQFLAMLSGAVIADVGVLIIPLMIGSIISVYGVEEGFVGFIISAELGCMSLAAVLMSPIVHKIDRRLLGVVGAALIITGNLISASNSEAFLLLVSRAIAGLGGGAALSASTAAAAEQESPETLFALIFAFGTIVAMTLFSILPPFIEQNGPQSIFYTMAVGAGVAGLLITQLPPRQLHGKTISAKEVQSSKLPILTLTSAALLGAYFCFQIAVNGSFFYVERIGDSIGMTLGEIGDALAISAFAMLLGSLFPLAVGDRLGRIGPLVFAVIVNAISIWFLTHTDSALVYLIALSASSAMLIIGATYFLGLSSVLVSGGRLATAARGAAAFGSTVAPTISGLLLLSGGDYRSIGWAGVGVSVIALLLLARVSLSRAKEVDEHN